MMGAACVPTSNQDFSKRIQSIVSDGKTLKDGYVQVSSPGINWFIYYRNGEAVYLSNSLEPYERLSRVLRGCLQETMVDSQRLLSEVQERFEQINSSPATPRIKADYQVLSWLAKAGHLPTQLMSQLIYKMNLEVMEAFALLQLPKDYLQQSVITPGLDFLPSFDIHCLATEATDRVKKWQTLQPELFSPYQRPYLTGAPLTDLPPEIRSKLRQVFIGFSWRQIAMLLNQDELALAQQFLPLFRKGVIKLHDPFSPFDSLPWKQQKKPSSSTTSTIAASASNSAAVSRLPVSTPTSTPVPSPTTTSAATIAARVNTPTAASLPVTPSSAPRAQWPVEARPTPSSSPIKSGGTPASGTNQPTKTWKIVCIDDSPAVLNEINRLLQADLFAVTLISDSKKALMKINSIKPDVILLDANMPGVDGYQVCTMLRKSATLKDIPVIMVTGNRGLVNRARAKLAGVTDYINKPFDQKDLLTMVFRYLSE